MTKAKTSFGARLAIAAGALAALLYAAPIVWLAANQRDLLFRVSTLRMAPSDAGLARAKEVAVKTQDGETLVGWFIAPTQAKPFLIYFHGNADTLEKRALRLQRMTDGGAGLLAVYSAGLGIPFLIAAFAVDRVSALLRRFRNQMQNVERAMGVLMIVTGIAFLTGTITHVSIWMLETFPALAKFG